MQNIMMMAFMSMGIFFLVIGLKEFRRTSDKEEYLLAGRNVGYVTLTLTFLATHLGGGVIIGSFEAAKTYGYGASFYAIGLGLGLCLLSFGFGQKFRRLEISTIPEIFDRIYGSKFLRRLTGFIMGLANFLILGAIAISLRKMTGSLFEQGDFLFIFFWAVLVFYAGLGGFAAVIRTDKFQVLAILAIFAVISFMLKDKINLDALDIAQTDFNALPLFEWIFLPLGFVLIGQDMGQRCFAGRTPTIVSRAALSAGILLMISAIIPVILGMIGTHNPQLGIIEIVLTQTNPVMTLIFGLAIIFAIVSTADSLLSALMCNLGEDLNVKIAGKNLWDSLNKLRIMVLFFGFCAGSFAFLELNIIPLMIVAYELTLIVMLVPILAALLLRNPKKKSAIASVATGCICYALHYFGILQNIPMSLMSIPWQVISFAISIGVYGMFYIV